MAFQRLVFKKHWTSEVDFPAYEESEEQVRGDLQYHPDALRDYLNEVLLRALESVSAPRSLGAAAGGVSGTLQDVLDSYLDRFEALDDRVRELVVGEIPETVRSSAVNFTGHGWTETEDGWKLRVVKSAHNRADSRFGCTVRQLVDGAYRAGTWDAAGVSVVYDEETGDMVLTAEHPFSGQIVFFGV